MAIINSDFTERYSKISDALEDLGFNDLEARLASGSNMAYGIVHAELFKDNTKVGEIIYGREPPRITFYDDSYFSVVNKLQEYFATH